MHKSKAKKLHCKHWLRIGTSMVAMLKYPFQSNAATVSISTAEKSYKSYCTSALPFECLLCCYPETKEAGAFEAPGQTKEELCANDTSRQMAKIAPSHTVPTIGMWYGAPDTFQVGRSSLEPPLPFGPWFSHKIAIFWTPGPLDRCLEMAKKVPHQ